MGKNNFCSLMPDYIEISEVYNEAFEYMMDKKIKNIAITGTYGAGKSSVLNSFIKNNKDKKNDKSIEEKDIITISLGNYSGNNNDAEHSDINSENKIENHIISQILAQIDGKKIPLLKGKIPVGKSLITISWNILLILSCILGLVLISFNISIPFIKSEVVTNIIKLILFILPIIISIYRFQKNNNEIKISGIKLKGIQTDVRNSFDEATTFDKDLKEIIYLLGNSRKKIVIFEDLDRFKDVTIFAKLKEINFIVNKYIETNIKKSDGIKFIYLLNDSLLDSKIRTKFFDFIVPIVPVTTSSNSETQLLQYAKNNIDISRQPSESFLCDISLYIDDMRLLRNIINEYIIYSNIISMDQLNLENDKLFALITIKNIFPKEYYSLQSKKGYIYSLLQKIKSEKQEKIKKLEIQQKAIENKQKELKQSLLHSEIELMTLFIPNDISILNNKETWAIFLKQWQKNPEANYTVYQRNEYPGSQLNYYNFVEEFINPKIDGEYEQRRDKLEKNIDQSILELNEQLEIIYNQILQINKGDNYTFFSLLTDEEREEFFEKEDNTSTCKEDNTSICKEDYFPIIKYFIINGIIDDSYMYYISDYSTDSLLKTNDVIYRKSVLEGREVDLFLDVESPKELVRRFTEKDFSQPYVVNYNIFMYCLSEKSSYVLMMTDSLIQSDGLNKLIDVMNNLPIDQLNRYVTLLISKKYTMQLKKLINYPDLKRRNIVLQNVYLDRKSDKKLLEDLKEYLIDDPEIIFSINENFEMAINNICKIDTKIPIIRRYKSLNSEKIEVLLEKQVYVLNAETIKNILIMYLSNEKIEYGELLNQIYNNSRLEKMKSYIKDNIDEFLEDYIANGNAEFNNHEDIIFDILDSNIELALKEQYLENNRCDICNIQPILDMDEFENYIYYLLEHNTLKCTSQNIKLYWNKIQEYDPLFPNFLNKNINQNNYQDILKDNIDICNTLINDKDISDELRLFMMEYADLPIKKIEKDLTHQQVYSLATRDFVEINDDNINILIEKEYYDILDEIETHHENILEVLLQYKELSEDTVKKFINNGLNDNLIVGILKNTSLVLSIKDIPATYKQTIEYIFYNYFNTLSTEDFEYILLHLEDFDEEFNDSFYEKLSPEILISILEEKYDKEQIILPILTSDHVSVDNKIFIIGKSIINRCDVDKVHKYMLEVPDIKNLATVWNGKYPNYDDNEYQQKIANLLEQYGYVKKRKDNKLQKIK